MFQGLPVFPGVNDFHQISKIAGLLGTPNSKNWKEFDQMPCFDKLEFKKVKKKKKFLKYFANIKEEEGRFLDKVLKYGKWKRASELLKLSYFEDIKPESLFLFNKTKEIHVEYLDLF